jgi:hypothetical protein
MKKNTKEHKRKKKKHKSYKRNKKNNKISFQGKKQEIFLSRR